MHSNSGLGTCSRGPLAASQVLVGSAPLFPSSSLPSIPGHAVHQIHFREVVVTGVLFVLHWTNARCHHHEELKDAERLLMHFDDEKAVRPAARGVHLRGGRCSVLEASQAHERALGIPDPPKFPVPASGILYIDLACANAHVQIYLYCPPDERHVGPFYVVNTSRNCLVWVIILRHTC